MRLSSRVSRVVWLLKMSSRWNLKNSKMVKKMTMSRRTAMMMTTALRMVPKLPVRKAARMAGMERRKTRTLMKVRTMV
jgi:hypothetical protein